MKTSAPIKENGTQDELRARRRELLSRVYRLFVERHSGRLPSSSNWVKSSGEDCDLESRY